MALASLSPEMILALGGAVGAALQPVVNSIKNWRAQKLEHKRDLKELEIKDQESEAAIEAEEDRITAQHFEQLTLFVGQLREELREVRAQLNKTNERLEETQKKLDQTQTKLLHTEQKLDESTTESESLRSEVHALNLKLEEMERGRV